MLAAPRVCVLHGVRCWKVRASDHLCLRAGKRPRCNPSFVRACACVCELAHAGLPADITEEEVADFFKKAGIIKLDYNTGKPRIRLYKNEDGTLKGEGTLCYLHEAGVELAMTLLDESTFRGKYVRLVLRTPACVLCNASPAAAVLSDKVVFA
ncbi:MAG: hypothetical protein EOO41_00490 [Methanobacteriota archaeon]|nr:MAG: hypothetical protein EOO41_00490 [Euryarchaeota archaeon]